MKRVPFVLFVVCLGAGLAASPQAQQQDKVQSSIGAGDMHMRFKDYAQAIASYSDAIKADPGSVEAYLKRTWAYLQWGGKANDDKALADAAKVIELEPANGSARFARGKVYFNRANSAKEAKNLKEARDLFGKALADYEGARVAYPNWIALLLDIGHSYFGRGDLDRALTAFSRAYEQKPSYSLNVDWALKGVFEEYRLQKREFDCGNAPRTWHLAGTYWATIHLPNRAIQCFSRALDLGMDADDVYYERSKAYAEKGDFASAIADASNAIKLMDIPGNYENRAEIYEKQGDLDNATKDYTQAVNYRKKDLKKAVSKDDYAWKAESLYSLYLKRGDAYYYKRFWDRAIADFMAAEKPLLPGPDRAKIHLLIADVYEQKGDARNAAKYRQKAQDEDPGAKK